MRTIYLESVGGASGDMLLGALCALGIDWDEFRRPLEDGLPELTMHRQHVQRQGLSVWRVFGEMTAAPPVRHLSDVETLLDGLDLPASVIEQSRKAFQRLAAVEAQAHGCTIEQVHFHELGATDSIMDIVGFFWALYLVTVEQVIASPLKLGYGTVETAHGTLPVPVPAVAGLVEGLPVERGDWAGELTTPTGALLIGQRADAFGPMPQMKVICCGTGAGAREGASLNVLRAWLGETAAVASQEPELVIDCNVDDMTPEQLSFARERLELAGALDVSMFTGIGKKGRPVHLIQVLVAESHRARVIDAIFRHTSTLGLRQHLVERTCLVREVETVELAGRTVRVNVAFWPGAPPRYEPEYEDCAALCRAGLGPLSALMAEARLLARQRHQGREDQ